MEIYEVGNISVLTETCIDPQIALSKAIPPSQFSGCVFISLECDHIQGELVWTRAGDRTKERARTHIFLFFHFSSEIYVQLYMYI